MRNTKNFERVENSHQMYLPFLTYSNHRQLRSYNSLAVHVPRLLSHTHLNKASGGHALARVDIIRLQHIINDSTKLVLAFPLDT